MRLPFILGASATIVVGVVNYISNTSNQEIYYRMAISMVVFYLLGLYVRNTIKKIEEEIRKKKEQEEIKAQKEPERQTQKAEKHAINLKAEDYDEDFLPLEMSKAVRTIALKDDTE